MEDNIRDLDKEVFNDIVLDFKYNKNLTDFIIFGHVSEKAQLLLKQKNIFCRNYYTKKNNREMCKIIHLLRIPPEKIKKQKKK